MASQSDDCYFFYNSTCAKTNDCPFRHESRALGSETTCELWEKGCCFHQGCKFRHSIIEKKRSQTACYYEMQASGCLKPNCPFLHTKPQPVLRNSTNPSIQTSNQPAMLAPVRGTGVAPPVGINQMSIPVLAGGPAPYHQFQRGPFHPRAPPPMGFNMPGVNPHMGRPPGPIRYPQFRGVPHPVDGGHNFGQAPLRAPMHFGRGGLPHGLPYSNPPYPMHMGREMTDFRPAALGERNHQQEESGSSDFSDYSTGSGDEGNRRSPRLSSRRKDQSSRRESSRRIVKNSRRHHQPVEKLKQHRGGSEDRKRTNRRSREKSPNLGRLKERERDKDRRKRCERGQERGKESHDKDSKQKEEKKESEEADKEKEPDSSSPDIKVKTLEEILREKALKKLEERRAKVKAQKENEEDPEKSSMSEDAKPHPPANGVEKEGASSDDHSENDAEELAVKKDDGSTKEEQSNVSKIQGDIEQTEASKEQGDIEQTEASKVQGDIEQTEASKESEAETIKDSPVPTKLTPSESSSDSFKVKSFQEIMCEKKLRKVESQSTVDQAECVTEQCSAKPAEKVLNSIVSPSKVPIPAGKGSRRVTVHQKKPNQTKLTDESNKLEAVKGRRVIRVTKMAAQSSDTGVKSESDVNPKQLVIKPTQIKKVLIAKELTPKENVCVKTFEEIMQEKRQRRTQAEKKEDVNKEMPVKAATSTLSETSKVAAALPLLKSKALPVIRPRKIKVIRRAAIKSENIKEGSRPTSPVLVNPEPGTTPESTTTKVSVLLDEESQPVVQNQVELKPAITDNKTSESVGQGMLAEDQVGGKSDKTQACIVVEERENDSICKSPHKRLSPNEEEKESEDLLNDNLTSEDVAKTKDPSADFTVIELPAKRVKTDPPSYEEIVHAVSQSSQMSDKDDFFDDLFSEAIGSLSPAGEEYADLHEDDLIMELEDMINE